MRGRRMSDESFRTWTVRLFCDAPSHIRGGRREPDFKMDGVETRAHYVKSTQRHGWVLQPDGLAICPECAAKDEQQVAAE